LLAFVRGLLLVQVKEDALAPAEPRPEVVERILEFLARRVLELEESLAGPSDADESTRLGEELRLTDRLLDLVLYLYHELDDEAIERVEQGAPS
jgi:CRP-like cAMP-binding protein